MPKKQKDGRYRAKLIIGYDRTGKAICKYLSGRTKRELEEAKAAARAYYIDGERQQRDCQFKEYLLQWYKVKKEPHLSASSKEAYQSYIYKHILPVFGDRMMRAIQPLELQQWVNGFAGKSKTLVVMVPSVVKAVLKSACAEGILSRDPTLGLILPKPSKPNERRAFTPEECDRIEEAIQTHKHGLLLAVFYFLGLRRGEGLGLKWEDINFRDRLVSVKRDIDYKPSDAGCEGELKTPAAYRDVPIPDALYALLQNARGLPHMFLFSVSGNLPLTRPKFRRIWLELMTATGFATPELKSEITPHYFRHNYATVLYNAGVDPVAATRILGHASYSTTARIYTHLGEHNIIDAGKKINLRLTRKKESNRLPSSKK